MPIFANLYQRYTDLFYSFTSALLVGLLFLGLFLVWVSAEYKTTLISDGNITFPNSDAASQRQTTVVNGSLRWLC